MEHIDNHLTFNNTEYYLTSTQGAYADFPHFFIYQCEGGETIKSCNKVGFFTYTYTEPNFQFRVESTTNDIYLMQDYDQPYYKISEPAYFFEWKNVVKTKNFTYDLYKYNANNKNTYILSKCEGTNWETCKTDFQHPITGYRFVDILGNEYSDNLYMLMGTDGDNIFRVYNDDIYQYEILDSGLFGCEIDSSLWGLVGVQKEGTYEYLLYESQGYLDFVPFHYSTPKKEDGKLIYNEGCSKNLLKVVINNNLIYSIDIRWRLYDYQPVCHVEECSIPWH